MQNLSKIKIMEQREFIKKQTDITSKKEVISAILVNNFPFGDYLKNKQSRKMS